MEEPHPHEGLPAEEGIEIPQSSTAAGSADEPGVTGVSGFLSGFAAAVQSTVSLPLPQ